MPKAETCEGTIEIGGIPPTTRPGYKPYFRDVSLRCARCLGPGGFAVMSIGGDSPDEVSDSAALDAGRGLARKDCKKFTGPGIMPDSFLPTRVEIWTPKRAAKIEGLLSALVANGVGLQKESVLRGLSKPEPASYLVYVGKDERSHDGYYLQYKPVNKTLEAWSDIAEYSLPEGVEQRISTKFPNATHEVDQREYGFRFHDKVDVHMWTVSERQLRAAASKPVIPSVGEGGKRARIILTAEELARAEARGLAAVAESEEGHPVHPVISVLKQNLPRILALGELKLADSQGFIRTHYGFLADELASAPPYTLQATDLVEIWSFVMQHFPGDFPATYQRQAFARMISTAYAVQGLDPEWKSLPRQYFQTEKFPEIARRDSAGLSDFNRRLDEIYDSIRDTRFYIWGVEDWESIIFPPGRSQNERSEEDQARIERLIEHQKERSAPLLDEVQENFRQVLGFLRSDEIQRFALGLEEAD